LAYNYILSLCDNVGLSGGLRKTIFSARVHFGRSRASKVIDFATNQKCVRDLLLVRHSNLGPILHRFGDITGFCAHDPPLFHPNFGVFPLDQIAHVRDQVSPSINLKLFGR